MGLTLFIEGNGFAPERQRRVNRLIYQVIEAFREALKRELQFRT